MSSVTKSAAIRCRQLESGLSVGIVPVDVYCDVWRGDFGVTVTGLADDECRAIARRVECAVMASDWSRHEEIRELDPDSLCGSFDVHVSCGEQLDDRSVRGIELAIAATIAGQWGLVSQDTLDKGLFFGELAPSGAVRVPEDLEEVAIARSRVDLRWDALAKQLAATEGRVPVCPGEIGSISEFGGAFERLAQAQEGPESDRSITNLRAQARAARDKQLALSPRDRHRIAEAAERLGDSIRKGPAYLR